MRRAGVVVVLFLSTALLASSGAALAGVTAGDEALARPAAAAAPRPPVKQVLRAYGEGPLELAYRQQGAISFQARRGDEVTLSARTKQGDDCRGSVTLTDGRGSRTKKLTLVFPVFRVRSAGRATIRFRPFSRWCAADDPIRMQLVKLRGRNVPIDGKPVRLGQAELGFQDVAWLRVPRTGRVKVTGRDPRGKGIQISQAVARGEMRSIWTGAVSVEHGATVGTPDPLDVGPVLRRGARVGFIFDSAARVGARSALTHTVELDGPPVTLTSGHGREHVLTVQLPAGIRTYLDPEYQWSERGTSYWLPPRPGYPTAAGTYRMVVASAEDAPHQERTVRIRSYLDAPDLVVDGPPVRYESVEPGQRFSIRVPASEDGPVRLAASDVNVTGGGWSAQIHPSCGHDCAGGARITSWEPSGLGYLLGAPSATGDVRFRPGATGSLTLTLTSVPR
ncbi:hypothetical protein [Nocardioides sp. 616]|uniref:hypothetical protein n=1 Tax=Nocardioides sp. 616 TaxID=2268090 RepID=UPI000CE36D3B|nr:hypothetical protein [Nocardioides sp. 616]